MNKMNLTITHCLTPLFFGGALYILFRSLNLRMFGWFSNIGLEHSIHSARQALFQLKNLLPHWTYYSLPDGLWVYAFTSALLILWDGKLNGWLLVPFSTGPCFEIAQALHFFPGTFDIVDIFFTISALILSIIIITSKFNQNETKIY